MDLSKTFVDNGILGAIVVVLAGVVVYLFRFLTKVQDARLQDQKDNAEKYHSAMGEFSRNNELLLAKLNGKGSQS